MRSTVSYPHHCRIRATLSHWGTAPDSSQPQRHLPPAIRSLNHAAKIAVSFRTYAKLLPSEIRLPRYDNAPLSPLLNRFPSPVLYRKLFSYLVIFRIGIYICRTMNFVHSRYFRFSVVLAFAFAGCSSNEPQWAATNKRVIEESKVTGRSRELPQLSVPTALADGEPLEAAQL